MFIKTVSPMQIPRGLARTFPSLKQMILVTYDGKKLWLTKECLQLPLSELTRFLLDW
jgi:hypothetical protein